MKSFIRTFLRAGLLFGVFMGLLYTFMSGPEFGIVAGLVGGFFFGLLMAVISTYLEIKAQNETPDFPGEVVKKQSAASHFVNGVAVGGYFFLTDVQLHFRPHRLNVNAKELSIPIAHISDTEKGSRLGVLPDQLKVLRTDGTIEKFVVEELDEWAEEINNARQNYLENPRSEGQRLFP
jgi:hypothetical protein